MGFEISETEAIDLFRRAVSEPLIVEETTFPEALVRWSRLLRQGYPLWALHPAAYAALSDTELPITHPLPMLVRSIARDEGLHKLAECDESPWGLIVAIDRRRCALIRGEDHPWRADFAQKVNERFEIFNPSLGLQFPTVLQGPILACYEPDTEYSYGGYDSPYEEIGVELVSLVEARESEPAGSKERQEAQDRLDEYLRKVAHKVPGYPTVIRDSAARKIVGEGYELMRILWSVFGSEIRLAAVTLKVLGAHSNSRRKPDEWAMRLVLPNLSSLEIRALRQRIMTSANIPSGSVPPPKQFTMELLAHRLRASVGTIARKVMHGWGAEMVETEGPCVVCGQVHPHGRD